MSRSAELYIPSLNGIRAIAALMVFVAHAGLGHVVPGGFGVTVFFFLSGYLITTLLRREYEQKGRISLSRFYLRRAYRILPPMYIVLAIALPLGFWTEGRFNVTTGALAAQFLHLTNYYLIFNGDAHIAFGTGPMWSLAIEEHFYLLYPLLLIAALARLAHRRTGQMLLVMCGVVLAWRCVLVYGLHVGHDYTYLATDTRFDSLLFGCAMGAAFNPLCDGALAGVQRATWKVLLLAATGVLTLSFLFRDENFRETFRYTLQGIALMPFFYCAIKYPHWPIFRWLEWPWVRGLGLISYTFYLCHLLALAVCERLVQQKILAGCLALAVAIGFSTLMYFGIERRLGALRRRLHPERPPAAPAPATAASAAGAQFSDGRIG